MPAPKVFISYSHDSADHKEWVLKLATCLVENGIDVLLDQWDLRLGSNLPKFMEQGLASSNRVLVVCTDKYNTKANDRSGGVGYEGSILSAELLSYHDTTKFIPCIRNIEGKSKVPICLSGRSYIDFTDDANFDGKLHELIHELHDMPIKAKPALGKNPFEQSAKIEHPPKLNQSSSAFFSQRFSDAFPGVRGIKKFSNPGEAVDRLKIFFRSPINFENKSPIWWWRDGDMHIDNFEVIAPDTVLIDYQEFIIDELIAVNSGAYYQSFIYLKTKPSESTNLYSKDSSEWQIKRYGYAREEFGLFKGQPVSRNEYDDGSAVIDGKVVSISNEVQLRVIYTTPYNLIIAPQDSPINNVNFDTYRNKILTGILKGEATIEELTTEFLKLPKRDNF